MCRKTKISDPLVPKNADKYWMNKYVTKPNYVCVRVCKMQMVPFFRRKGVIEGQHYSFLGSVISFFCTFLQDFLSEIFWGASQGWLDFNCLYQYFGITSLNPHTRQIGSDISCVRYNPDTAVGIATSYWLDDRGAGVRVPVGSRIFISVCRSDRLWGPPNLLSNG
jgi:hypothetical protein